jgi:hypothetical protein
LRVGADGQCWGHSPHQGLPAAVGQERGAMWCVRRPLGPAPGRQTSIPSHPPRQPRPGELGGLLGPGVIVDDYTEGQVGGLGGHLQFSVGKGQRPHHGKPPRILRVPSLRHGPELGARQPRLPRPPSAEVPASQ